MSNNEDDEEEEDPSSSVAQQPPQRLGRRVMFRRAQSFPCPSSAPMVPENDKSTNIRNSFSVAVQLCYEEPTKGACEEDDHLCKTNSMPFKPLKSCLSASQLPREAIDNEDTSRAFSVSPRNKKTLKRKVSFGHIHIREHPRALGDHPAVSSGPALSLDWYSEDAGNCQTTAVPLDEYEQGRQLTRKASREEIRLPRHERQNILLNEAGITFSELDAYTRETAQLKRSRRMTAVNDYRHDLDDDQEDDENNSRIPPMVKMLQNVGKKLFLFHEKQGQEHSVEQKQLDELMARAKAAERIRHQHQVAYWEAQRAAAVATTTKASSLPTNKDEETASVNKDKLKPRLPHSASEPYFLSLVCSSTDDSSDTDEAPEF